ncbi:sulfur carrier protein [Anaerobranca californiensis DSM 14826]|jgi:sulfur carrier protein|uniref:Sulfur carrier protein n=1 Tax=Anaerobranca californiensis DSM 14826 TaxID=1120989 RepID=A0A1M6NXU4_9FIRM|nr:sulfur carrier protein ThiS [Anaerobranca californiensis]SHK00470.1 sulfur carrier protein [Anaerobranca californiensis DSM 14826]
MEYYSITIDQLLKNLNLKEDVVVVEVNHEIVDKRQFSSKIINEGDKVEIVSFVGGG